MTRDGETARKLVGVPWLAGGALPKLLAVLNGDGEEARVVGGAVRNALLDLPSHEIDVATTATPDEVTRRVTAAGFKAVPTGIEHGTVTVVVGDAPFEVTTLRQDVETYGRHAKVAFGRDWRTDAERRDFTINAFSVSPDGTVYDYVGGLDDLDARRVRFIGDPKKRIEEDYLRILRFFRFDAAYGTSEHPYAEGIAACIAGRDGFDRLSRERVRQELMKLLVAPHALPSLISMADGGLLLRVLGGVGYLSSFEMMAKVEAAAGLNADPVRRLGALGVAIVEDAERLWQKLRLSNVEQARLMAMGEGWRLMSPDIGAAERRALVYRLKPQDLHRSRAARLVAFRGWRARQGLARSRDIAAALDGAGFPDQGGGFYGKRCGEGPGAGRRHACGGRGVDPGGFSGRRGGADGDHRVVELTRG